jgi:protein-tyrosine phosphatase
MLTAPVGRELRLSHPVLPPAGRLWGAGRPGYPDEPPPRVVVEAGVRAWRAQGVDMVVSLIEDWEVTRRAPGLLEAIGASGLQVRRFPVVDFGAPQDVAAFSRLLDEVSDRLAAGAGVLVHCNAGLGRTAVALGALLRRRGFAADPVREIRRLYRANAMEVAEQEAFVRSFPLGGAGDGGGPR